MQQEGRSDCAYWWCQGWARINTDCGKKASANHENNIIEI